jgi:hypothetical protein
VLDNHAVLGDAAGVSYPGGKNGSGVYQAIINRMPPHQVYIEPFLGGGAILRLKRPAALNIGVDLDRDVIAGWMRSFGFAVKASSSPLARNGGGDVGTVRSGVAGSILATSSERRRRRTPDLAISAETTEPGDADRRAQFGDGGPASNPPMVATPAERGVVGPRYEFLHADGVAFLASFRFSGNELVYCDPPYLMSTRSGKRLYQHEMSDVDHRRLLRVLQDLPCAVMISGYSSVLYAQMLKGWNATSFPASTRGGHQAAEWLWSNFERPVVLHDYRYLGDDFRERERIKRKKLRWVAKLQRMPVLERQALLAAIADSGVSDGPRGGATRSEEGVD